MENPSEVFGHAPARQTGLQDAHDHEIVLAGEVLDVLGDQHPLLLSCCRRHLSIRSSIEATPASSTGTGGRTTGGARRRTRRSKSARSVIPSAAEAVFDVVCYN
jgi:hypothetical protein